MALTRVKLSAIVEGDLSKVEVIDLSKRDFKLIEDFSYCKALRRIELRHNKLKDLDFLAFNLDLRWIDAQQNEINGRFGGSLRNLRELSVLNLSHNEITNVDEIFDSLKNLKSLVLNDNQIKTIQGIAKAQSLQALSKNRAQFILIVLSNNQLQEFQIPKKEMPNLKKLSLGNNKIKKFDCDINIFNLRELRLNSNNLIDVPGNLYWCGTLEILDLGKNNISCPSGMSPSQYCADKFRRCKKLKSLNLSGNTKLAVTPEQWEVIRIAIVQEVPTLQIFNSRNFGTTRKTKKRRFETEHYENESLLHGQSIFSTSVDETSIQKETKTSENIFKELLQSKRQCTNEANSKQASITNKKYGANKPIEAINCCKTKISKNERVKKRKGEDSEISMSVVTDSEMAERSISSAVFAKNKEDTQMRRHKSKGAENVKEKKLDMSKIDTKKDRTRPKEELANAVAPLTDRLTNVQAKCQDALSSMKGQLCNRPDTFVKDISSLLGSNHQGAWDD